MQARACQVRPCGKARSMGLQPDCRAYRQVSRERARGGRRGTQGREKHALCGTARSGNATPASPRGPQRASCRQPWRGSPGERCRCKHAPCGSPVPRVLLHHCRACQPASCGRARRERLRTREAKKSRSHTTRSFERGAREHADTQARFLTTGSTDGAAQAQHAPCSDDIVRAGPGT